MSERLSTGRDRDDMSETKRCVHCGQPVRVINYALGPEVLHIDPAASFPTERKGTAWRFCRLQRATRAPAPAGDSGGERG